MSNIFALQKNADSLKAYAFPILEIAKEINATQIMTGAYNDISVYYELKNEPVKALQYYKRGKELEDSLQNADKLKSLADIESKYESEKKDKEISLLGELQKAKDEEISKQRTINIIIACGLLLVLVLSFFIFRQYSQKKKANNLLETQNQLIVEKNRNITDSINYAKVIQNALLPQEQDFISLFSSAFIVFKPKDIVSGDFYWFTEKHGKKIVAAVVCTGHGVTGAFMSMIGITFLNEIINEKGITTPAEVLGEMRNRVKASLKQRGLEGESKDGMDMALLCFDADQKTVEYAGANNSLWRVKANAEFEEINPDKRPIGYYKGQGLPFTNHRIELNKGDALYIFTDGFADQFGGPKGKKFKYKQLKELLVKIHNDPMQQQKTILNNTFEEWRGNMEQTDDICLIGLKIS
jgi:serine phosphatase RsbU (regulator of sigma subunit)